MQPAAFTPTRKAASGRLDPTRVALFGPRVETQVLRPDSQASGARGVARPKPGPGRGAGPVRGEVTPGRWRPGSSSPIKPVSRNATNSDPTHWASGARGVARPKPGPGRGAGPVQGDVTPGRLRPVSSSPIKPVSHNATSSLHAHSEGSYGEAAPPTHGTCWASRGNPGTATRLPGQWR